MVDQLKIALDALRSADFKMGDDFERAHSIAQAHEGEPLFDWLHALTHRIEGDMPNAYYWYRRAGIAPFKGSFEEEATALAAGLSNK